MIDELPAEIQDHVNEVAKDKWFERLGPRSAGSTDNPFFRPNSDVNLNPSVERRAVTAFLPSELHAVYASYPCDVEFSAPRGWTFLSEREIIKRASEMEQSGQNRVVDFAYVYAGMGHIQVLSYDPVTKCVFTDMDGGSNGFDRMSNNQRRIQLSVETVHKIPFSAWWDVQEEA